ncbi:MAG: glycogen debranching protein GlgX [bacterium]|nr:glycogen debranching protein GlgX [bacterium]
MLIPTAILPGKPYPLGATWTGDGVNFAVYSEYATLVQLCLFDEKEREVSRINLRWNDNGVWHCFLSEARPGLRYGFRAHGPYEPEEGHHFNPSKLLLDPYAKMVTGPCRWHESFNGYRLANPAPRFQGAIPGGSGEYRAVAPQGPVRDDRNSANYMPKSVVIDPNFPWDKKDRPQTPLQNSIIYELHVKGFTQELLDVPPALRGTYAGLGHAASVAYLKKLGVTAVELLPVQLSMSEPRLTQMGLSNYWGYNTIGFFTPDPRFAYSSNPVREFQEMVRSLHSAGIEVILDVVYNHTAEQGEFGPTISFRGLDNYTYYRVEGNDPGSYINTTGCGNSLDTRQPKVMQLVTDSLRYWVEYMHADGFRFDLATTIARTGFDHHFDSHCSLLDAIAQDPVLNTVKLIAEPWDCGYGGYQLGNFPQGWSEWNDSWRDTIRCYWRGDSGLLGRLASKISGSSDSFYRRSPLASINFVTAHDGFTLADLVTYERKQNWDNGENNRDGNDNNLNWNCGEEGPSASPKVRALRLRQQRNMLLTLLLSQGVPMLTAGDEFGRSQQGNNNAYCQDSAISYLHWDWTDEQEQLWEFVRRVIALRREHPAFRRTTFFKGEEQFTGVKDVIWYNENGLEMENDDWNGRCLCLGMYIAGDYLEGSLDERGLPQRDNSFLLIFSNNRRPQSFVLPKPKSWAEWRIILDTEKPERRDETAGKTLALAPFNAVVMLEAERRR